MKFSLLQMSLWKNRSYWQAGSQCFTTINHFAFCNKDKKIVCDNILPIKNYLMLWKEHQKTNLPAMTG